MSVLKTIAKRYLDVPQLITPSAFEEIASLLDMKKGREELKAFFEPMTSETKLQAKMVDPFYSGYRFSDGDEQSPAEYGVMKIEGPLTYKPEMNMCAPDTCNYQDLVKQMEMFADEGKKRVFMIHDSCGGEAFGMFSTSKQVRKIADENGIELIGYVDGLSASASYGWLSVCDKIYASEASSIGSIGVVISLLNNSGALEKAGLKRQFITAGASKVPFSDEGDFKEEFLEGLQEDVDALYEKFVSHVDTYRKEMSEDTIKSTEAKVFRAEKALELGLIDEIMEVSEFKEKYLVGGDMNTAANSNKTPNYKANKMSDTNIDMAAFEAMKEKLAAFEATEAARKLSAKKDSITEQLSAATFLSNMENIVEFMVGAEDAQSALLTSVINDATAALAAQKEEAAAELTKTKEELTATITSLTTEKEELVVEKETIKEEFSKTETIREEEKESNLEDLGHKEKLARAVAAAKAKQA